MEVRFPFGYGLSYTSFEYSNLRLDSDKMTDGGFLTAYVDVAIDYNTCVGDLIEDERTGPLGELIARKSLGST